MKIEIKHRWSGEIIFTADAENLKLAVLLANKQKVSLSGADLRSADLSGADLSGADLSGAVLRSAVLRSAVLRSAVLRSADLSGAVLRSADLRSAVLSGADLRSADLRSADLSGAVLRSADLSGADLRSADLTPIRDDFWNVLLTAPAEVMFLRKALEDGKVDGSTYSGECACLVGTIANARHCSVQALGLLKPDSNRPIERFFLGIKPGDTPKKNPLVKLAIEWLDQWVGLQKDAAKVFAGK